MEPLISIPYEEVEFVWISDHWDFHLEGLCRYNKKLCRFMTNTKDDKVTGVSIYSLSVTEKLRWIRQKKFFEWCVGYHWTYPQRQQDIRYSSRKPRIFWQLIFWLYYLPNKLKNKWHYRKK